MRSPLLVLVVVSLLAACATVPRAAQPTLSPAVRQAEILFADAEDEGRWSHEDTIQLSYLIVHMTPAEREETLAEWDRQLAAGTWRLVPADATHSTASR